GDPVVAVNLVGWPGEVLTNELLQEVLAGGLAIAEGAGVPVIGGPSFDDPEPKYAMAVTGTAPADRLLRNDAARPGLPITLTNPLGAGLLNNPMTATRDVSAAAIETIATPNTDASRAALAAQARAAHAPT